MKLQFIDTIGQVFRGAVVALLLGNLAAVAQAQQVQCPTNPGRFAPMADSARVLDRYTGLIWKRCSEGQTWDGSMCTGTATTHTHEAAMILAGQAPAGWRLPNVRELESLQDIGCVNPAIDRVAFPNTPYGEAFWTTTPFAYNASYAWEVGFGTGGVGYRIRSGANRVRLVRDVP